MRELYEIPFPRRVNKNKATAVAIMINPANRWFGFREKETNWCVVCPLELPVIDGLIDALKQIRKDMT